MRSLLAALPLQALLWYVLWISDVQAQTTPDQSEGRPKYQRALTDLVPANLITVLDKYHRPITNNYVPEPTKQKLTKAEILARFTTQRTTSTTTTTTTTSTTTRKPTTFVTSFPIATSVSAGNNGATEPPFRILFIQTTTSSPLSASGETENTTPAFFSHIVTQTAKTVTVIEDGQEKIEPVDPDPPAGLAWPTTVAPQIANTSPVNFSPVFIYKNHRFTSDSPKPVVNVATTVTTSDGEMIKAQTVPVQQSQPEKATAKLPTAATSPRPRRKVIKIKSRKTKKENKLVKAATTTTPSETDDTKEPRTTVKIVEAREPTTVKETQAQPLERPKGFANRRLNVPQRARPTEKPKITSVGSTTPVPASEIGATSLRSRRPGGLRRLAVGVNSVNRVLAKEQDKPTSATPAPAVAAASTLRPLFRTRVPVTATRAPSTVVPVPAPTSSTTIGVFEPTKAPIVRRLPSTTTPLRSSIAATRLASTTRAATPGPETPTPLPQTSTTTKTEVAVKGTSPRLPLRRVVTRIGTARPATAATPTTPIPETPTIAPLFASTPPKSTDAKEVSKARKVVKRKRKPTPPPTSPAFPRTTVTPVSIVYFQTTTGTTTAPPITYHVSRRTVKRRRKKPPIPAGVVSTQPFPISFSPTEPSTFSAPAAVTGFRPLTTSGLFASPTPNHHLETLPKTDEISQVINLPGGRLSSYQTRYVPQLRQPVESQALLPERNFTPLSSISSVGRPYSRLAPHQRAIRPGPSFSPEAVDFYGADGVGSHASYPDLQRLLVSENSRFLNQQRNSARFAGFQTPLDY